MLKADYLETMLKTFNENNVGIIYNSLEIINLKGKVLSPQPKWAIYPSMNRFEILNKMFYSWNVLASPRMAVKTEALKKVMPLNRAEVNLQDYILHIKLLLEANSIVLQTPKILYRFEATGTSLSSRNSTTINREQFKTKALMDNFLNIKDINILKQIFPNKANEFKSNNLIPFYLGKRSSQV